MPDTTHPAGHATRGRGRYRLRRSIYDSLMTGRDADTVDQQVVLTGVARRTLMRIRAGGSPDIDNAMRISTALGEAFEALFERVEDTEAAS